MQLLIVLVTAAMLRILQRYKSMQRPVLSLTLTISALSRGTSSILTLYCILNRHGTL